MQEWLKGIIRRPVTEMPPCGDTQIQSSLADVLATSFQRMIL